MSSSSVVSVASATGGYGLTDSCPKIVFLGEYFMVDWPYSSSPETT